MTPHACRNINKCSLLLHTIWDRSILQYFLRPYNGIFFTLILIFKKNICIYVCTQGYVHVNAGVYRSQRCQILLELNFQVAVSCPKWALGPPQEKYMLLTCYVANLRLPIFLPQHLECLYHRHIPPRPTFHSSWLCEKIGNMLNNIENRNTCVCVYISFLLFLHVWYVSGTYVLCMNM